MGSAQGECQEYKPSFFGGNETEIWRQVAMPGSWGVLAPELRYWTKKSNCCTGALSWNVVVDLQQAASHMDNSLESDPSSPKEHGVGQLVKTQIGYQVHYL